MPHPTHQEDVDMGNNGGVEAAKPSVAAVYGDFTMKELP